jgi:hypothetical protein
LGYTVRNNEPYSAPDCASTADCVFPNGVIPARAVSPISSNLLGKYVPLPNVGMNQYLTASQVSTIRDDKAGQRVDFNSTRFGNWYGYYHYDDTTKFTPSGFGPTFGNFSSQANSRVQQFVLSNTKSFGPTAVNEAHLNYTRNAGITGEPTDPTVPLSSLGFVTGADTLGIVNTGPQDWQSVPPIALNDFNFGRSNQAQGLYENTYHASDDFSKIWGKHTVKFGGAYARPPFPSVRFCMTSRVSSVFRLRRNASEPVSRSCRIVAQSCRIVSPSLPSYRNSSLS